MDGFRINPYHHTGKPLPHHHTSYAALTFLLLWISIILGGLTTGVTAESYKVNAVVNGPKPTVAAQILSPANSYHTSVIPTNISGSCQKGMLVNIYKNEVLAGAVLCSSGGAFTLPIDLFIGRNDLVARVYSPSNQAGPDSAVVTVYYDPPGFPSSLLTGGSSINGHGNVVIKSDSVYRGNYTGEDSSWQLDLEGGLPPYAVNVDWGDGQNDLVSRTGPGAFTIKHVYHQAGTGYKSSFIVTVKATDAEGSAGYLQLVTIISDKAIVGSLATPSGSRLLLAWPIVILAIFVVISYWLGEVHEKRVLKQRALTS